MPACAAGDDLHALKILEFLLADVHLIEEHFPGVLRNSSEQSVAHRARLLENLLLHEMFEPALFRHDRVPSHMLRLAVDRVSIEIHHADALRRQDREFAIAQEEHAARVLQNCGNVAGDEKFLFAESYHDGWTHPSGHNL